MEFELENFKTQGIKMNYYYVCKRKLWLFDKGISMESNSDRVLQGKIVHENSYQRQQKKEVLIDDIIRLDIMDKDYVKEVKISSKMEKSDKMQLLYYLFYLKSLGINKKGTVNYVKEKRVEEVELTPAYEEEIKNTLVDIKNILRADKPPKVIKLPYCTKCAYYEYCFVKEKE
ncbi:CRISPR-associated protein Cas4 [Clostridium sp. 19966]|uniref:CRISPR-associated protein Cas4 n=1 Tax=Clostridium sp. 19966 TaxID=2768166 RepID=UPI0028DD99A9|nr:CRISPR-associated protein Cas4 [Clostridium sp. 19966]MDT8719678.1 CRISPR-associated protein Cas4 [Clostridium sp. 19966]